jgi:hypothetical protein
MEITKTHLYFEPWAESHSLIDKDWYLYKAGSRDESKLYRKAK